MSGLTRSDMILVDCPTQLICISDIYMSTDKYKRHSSFCLCLSLVYLSFSVCGDLPAKPRRQFLQHVGCHFALEDHWQPCKHRQWFQPDDDGDGVEDEDSGGVEHHLVHVVGVNDGVKAGIEVIQEVHHLQHGIWFQLRRIIINWKGETMLIMLDDWSSDQVDNNYFGECAVELAFAGFSEEVNMMRNNVNDWMWTKMSLINVPAVEWRLLTCLSGKLLSHFMSVTYCKLHVAFCIFVSFCCIYAWYFKLRLCTNA